MTAVLDRELLEEINNIMQYANEEIAQNDFELAEEYLADAAYLINKIEDEKLRNEIAGSYTINPLDYAK